jgi:hypothetical protein
MIDVERIDFRGTALRNEIGQAGTRAIVKGTPMVSRAYDIIGHDACQAFACPVPDNDAALCVEDKGRYIQALHELDGEIQSLDRLHAFGSRFSRTHVKRPDVNSVQMSYGSHKTQL